MKTGWKKVTLREASAFVSTGPFGSMLHKSDYVEDGVPVVNPTNMLNSRINVDRIMMVNEKTKEKLSRYSLLEGDVVVARRGELGRCAVVGPDEEGWLCGTGSFFIRPLKTTNPRYLSYLFMFTGVRERLEGDSTGATMKNLSNSTLSKLAIPLPPPAEQKCIVAVLDDAFERIDTAIANAEKNLANAREFFKNHLDKVFSETGDGWTEKAIGEIAKIKGGKRVPKGYKLLSEPTPYPYLRVTDFSDLGTINTDELRYIDKKVFLEIKNYTISCDDLYISIAGTIGKSGIVPKELDGANLSENACKLVFNKEVANEFAYYFTLTSSFIEQSGLNTRVAAQPKLALSRLATIKIRFPSISEQTRIAGQIDTLRDETINLSSLFLLKIEKLNELKQSLLQKAFSGEFTTDFNPEALEH